MAAGARRLPGAAGAATMAAAPAGPAAGAGGVHSGSGGHGPVVVLEFLSQWVLPLFLLAFVVTWFWAILRTPRRTW